MTTAASTLDSAQGADGDPTPLSRPLLFNENPSKDAVWEKHNAFGNSA